MPLPMPRFHTATGKGFADMRPKQLYPRCAQRGETHFPVISEITAIP